MARLKREVSFCRGFESVGIEAVWRVDMETLGAAAGDTVGAVWCHVPPFRSAAFSTKPLCRTEKVHVRLRSPRGERTSSSGYAATSARNAAAAQLRRDWAD